MRFHNSIIHTSASAAKIPPLFFFVFFYCGGSTFKAPSRSGGEVKISFVLLGLPKDTLLYSCFQITESASGVSTLKFENKKKKKRERESWEMTNTASGGKITNWATFQPWQGLCFTPASFPSAPPCPQFPHLKL